MKSNNRIFNLYFIMMIGFLLFMVWYTQSKVVSNNYTMGQFKKDLQSGNVVEVVIEPNKEVPTGGAKERQSQRTECYGCR